VCWTVITRYLTETPATWAGEISAMAFCWMVFIGGAACFKRGIHISIDMLVAALPAGPRAALATAVDALVAAFLLFVSVLAVDFTIESWTTPMPSLRWSYSYYYAGAALGLALMTLRHAQAALARRRAAAGG
jgi:TRAP-type C4-dicarboxylate transport system permease small subunit